MTTEPTVYNYLDLAKVGDICYNCRQPFQLDQEFGFWIKKGGKHYASHFKCPK